MPNPITVSPFTQELRHKMTQLKYSPPRQSSSPTHVPHQLQDCDYIFIRNDAVKRPLTLTYQGPFKVLKHSEKYLTIDQGSRTDTVSIDRVKPAFLEKTPQRTELVLTRPDTEPAPTKPPSWTACQETDQTLESSMPPSRHTRSGRKVTFPSRYKTYIYY